MNLDNPLTNQLIRSAHQLCFNQQLTTALYSSASLFALSHKHFTFLFDNYSNVQCVLSSLSQRQFSNRMTESTVNGSIIKRRGRSTGAPRCVRRKADSGWWFMPREVRFRSVSLSRNFKRREFIQLQFSNLRVTPSTSEMGRRGGGGVGFGRIPDRWLQYDPVGKHVENTRFIPFKCPLDANFFNRNKEIVDDDVFTVDLLLEMAKRVGKKIGLVIDLTNTQRYYYPAEFTSQGIEYQKLNCPGHERAPPDALIGVHCTHGLNRTGYLIGRYMIDEGGWNAEEFINMFEHCRGHPIERQGYKDKLKWAQEQRDLKEAAAKAENKSTQ